MNKLSLFWLTLCCIPAFLISQDAEQLVRRVQAHLIIQDRASAKQEAEEAMKLYPKSCAIHEAYIQALAVNGEEKKMIQAWDAYVKLFPEKQSNRPLVEAMAWGVLDKASLSPSLMMRLMAILAGFFSQDVKGVAILHRGLKDSNATIRTIAIELASKQRDAKLKEEIKRLFKEESVWVVRKQVIQAAGKMKIKGLKSELEALVASESTSLEEKKSAIQALLSLLENVQRNEMVRLAASNRTGLKLLACEAVARFRSYRDGDLLFNLAHDSHPEVCSKALQSIGFLRPQDLPSYPVKDLALYYADVSNPKIAISASWLLTLYDPEEGQKRLKVFLYSSSQEIQLLAAAAVASTGSYGAELALNELRVHPNLFVRLNLAVGLIGQRRAAEEAGAVIYQALQQDKSKWVQKQEGVFSLFVPRSLSSSEEDPTLTPEMENQLTRLDLLNLLAIIKHPSAGEGVKSFLSETKWGISSVAAALLLTEGDEASINIVQKLLEDSNPKIRLQAALILSLWSHEEKAIQILQDGYQQADKELKGRILEGLGRIGSIDSLPFLIEQLKEPSQTLRIIAAMALIQCVNH